MDCETSQAKEGCGLARKQLGIDSGSSISDSTSINPVIDLIYFIMHVNKFIFEPFILTWKPKFTNH